MGNMTQNLFAISIAMGVNSAIETLVSQTSGGGNLELCGVYLNRGRYILTLLFIPITILLFNVESVLNSIEVTTPNVARYTQEYILAFLPGLFLMAHTDLHRKFLNSLGKNNVPMVCLTLGTLTHFVWCQIFVINLQMGITGIGIALIITNTIIFSS